MQDLIEKEQDIQVFESEELYDLDLRTRAEWS
jgi:hypothetical protein